MIESLIDHMTDHDPPDGWRMANNNTLADPTGAILHHEKDDATDPPGSFALIEEDTNERHTLRATLWTDNIELAVVLARAAAAFQETEVNPGWTVEISTARTERGAD